MRYSSAVCLLVFCVVAAIAIELSAQTLAPESKKRRRFNQVFVKVIVAPPPLKGVTSDDKVE